MILDWFVRHKRFGKFKNFFDRDVFPTCDVRTFPKLIHLYWDQGFEDAPPIVNRSLQSWADLNPGWELRLWTGDSAERVVSRSDLPPGLKITPYSDILRAELLRRYGGVWTDATTLCTRPLEDWLVQIMVQTDFFAFSRPGRDREIASWFLASRPGTPLIEELCAGVSRFWKRQEKPTQVYHWFQYIFEFLERTSAGFRREWATAPRIAAAPLLMMQEQLTEGREASSDELELYRALPMHKLTHKREIDFGLLERTLAFERRHQ